MSLHPSTGAGRRRALRRARRRRLPAAVAAVVVVLAVGAAVAVVVEDGRDDAAPRLLVRGPLRGAPAVAKPTAATPATEAQVALVAPRGGLAAFHAVLPRPASASAPVRAVVEDLRGPGGARLTGSSFRIRRELAVPLRRSSERAADPLDGPVPDPLVPLASARGAAGPQALFVDVDVPRSQRPGRYAGALVVSAAGRPAGRLPIALTVSSVVLPARHALRTWFVVWDATAERVEGRRGAARAYHRMLAEAGIGDGTADGVDAAVGVGPQRAEQVEAPGADLPALARAASAATRRLTARRPVEAYSYVFDEPTEAQRSAIRAWGEILHRYAPGVRQLVTAPPDPALAGAVDVWASHLSALPGPGAAGGARWSYSSCCERRGDPTLLLDDAAASNAAVAPATWLLGARGLLYWGVSAFGTAARPNPDPSLDPENAVNDGRAANGDGWLLYPGRPLGLRAPVGSLRLELVRLGLQLTDEAALLARRDRPRAEALLRRLVGDDGPAEDAAVWARVEAELLRAIAGEAGTRTDAAPPQRSSPPLE